MGVELDLQAAIVARLTAAAVGGAFEADAVYDVRPQTDPAGGGSYFVVGDTQLPALDVDEVDSFDALVRVHCWSWSRGSRPILTMQGQAYAALHDFALVLTRYGGSGQVDWRCVSCLRETSRLLPEDDGTFHGVCDYRVIIEAA